MASEHADNAFSGSSRPEVTPQGMKTLLEKYGSRQVPESFLEAHAENSPYRALASKTEVGVDEHARQEKVLLFKVANLHLAIPLDRIRIVQRSEGLDPLPESPRHVVGLMELNSDESVPVVDLAHSLGIRNASEGGAEATRNASGFNYLDSTRGDKEHILVYDSEQGTVGFLIDRAEAVVEAAIYPLPSALADAESSLVGLARVEGKTAYLIDLERHTPQS